MWKTTWMLLALAALLAGRAHAQQCDPGDCEGPPPPCGGDAAICNEDHTWSCPRVVCAPDGEQECRNQCGTWDSTWCECVNIPDYCPGHCDAQDRDACEFNGGIWDEYWCECVDIPEDGLTGTSSLPRRPGTRTVRMGHAVYPPARTSCEEERGHIPTSLAISLGPVRLHTGGPLIDHSGERLPHVWGTSQLVLWGVRDENTALMKRSDMLATEYVTQIGGLPASINLDRTVSVPDGVFGDIYALVRENPPTLQPGEYSLIRQIINIHWSGSEWYEVLRHCVKITYNDVIVGAPCN